MTATIGTIDCDVIVAQLALTAEMMDVRAEDVAAFTATEWADLAGRAFGVWFGQVRLGVLLKLHEQDEEITRRRRDRMAAIDSLAAER